MSVKEIYLYDKSYKEGYDKGYEDALRSVSNYIKTDYAAYLQDV